MMRGLSSSLRKADRTTPALTFHLKNQCSALRCCMVVARAAAACVGVCPHCPAACVRFSFRDQCSRKVSAYLLVFTQNVAGNCRLPSSSLSPRFPFHTDMSRREAGIVRDPQLDICSHLCYTTRGTLDGKLWTETSFISVCQIFQIRKPEAL